MDYISPSEVAEIVVTNGANKSRLSIGQLSLRGFLSGALLGFATTVAFAVNVQGLPPVVGAILFPVGFAMIVVLGLELVTGSFAMLPAAWLASQTGLLRVFGNLALVFAANLAGACLYAWMYAAVQTQLHHVPAAGAGALIVAAAQAKTLGYQNSELSVSGFLC
jgi:formate transporter